jgi:methylphosphotriester-DNA--protein-cysteine methyltransferase
MLQINHVGCDKEKTVWTMCGPPFAASKKSDIYHCEECPIVKKIKPENLIWFNTAQEACNAGYSPCSICSPPGCNRLPSPNTVITKIPVAMLI